jgi:hypothetical protein
MSFNSLFAVGALIGAAVIGRARGKPFSGFEMFLFGCAIAGFVVATAVRNGAFNGAFS